MRARLITTVVPVAETTDVVKPCAEPVLLIMAAEYICRISPCQALSSEPDFLDTRRFSHSRLVSVVIEATGLGRFAWESDGGRGSKLNPDRSQRQVWHTSNMESQMIQRGIRVSLIAGFVSSVLLLVVCSLSWLVVNQRRTLTSMHNELTVARQAMLQMSRQELSNPRFQYTDFDELKIVALPDIDYGRIFSKSKLRQARIESYGDFHAFAESRYETTRDSIASAWDLNDEQLTISFFYVNLVSRMWGFGNPSSENSQRSGCVASNEMTGFQTIEYPTIQTYVQSDIGCCTDHSHLMAFLLTRSGITNRRISAGFHTFNEALIDNRWVVLDATHNSAIKGSWETIQNRQRGTPGAVTVILFPHHNLIEVDNSDYRPLMGAIRLSWLINIVKCSAPVSQIREYDLGDL